MPQEVIFHLGLFLLINTTVCLLRQQSPMSDVHSFSKQLHELLCYYKSKREDERVENYLPLATKYFCDPVYMGKKKTDFETIEKIEKTVKSMFPDGRFEFQKDLHNQILRATLRQTLGAGYNNLVERICKERNWKGPTNNLFTVASRRSGKTTGMASMVASLLIHIPKLKVVVYSVALRTAVEFVRLVENYITMTEEGRNMIVNPGGSEMLILRGPELGDIRTARSFPSFGRAKDVSFFSFCSFLFVMGNFNLTKNVNFKSVLVWEILHSEILDIWRMTTI